MCSNTPLLFLTNFKQIIDASSLCYILCIASMYFILFAFDIIKPVFLGSLNSVMYPSALCFIVAFCIIFQTIKFYSVANRF